MRALFFLALFYSVAVGAAQANELVVPPGNAIGLVAPPDFHVSSNISGFESQERQTSILL